MSECVVTGVVRDLSGNIVANGEIQFARQTDVFLYDGSVRQPDLVTVRTDGGGAISVPLVPGNYRVSLRTNQGQRSFRIAVPELATAFLGDLMTPSAAEIVVISPLVVQAQEAASEAEAAAAAAVAAAGQVVGFDTRAAFVSANTATPGLGMLDGQVMTAAGYEYRRLASSTAIADLLGWVPNGENTPQHFGAVGNGIADDTLAFQRAALGSRYVFVPRGAYNLTTNVTGLWEFENDVTFSGAGIATKTFRLLTRGTEAAHTRGFDHFHRFQGTIPTGAANFGHNAVLVDDLTNSGDKLVAGTMFQHTIRAGVAGTRYCLHSWMQVVGTKAPGGYQGDVSQASYAWSIANQNGTGAGGFTIPDDSYKGELFGGNDNAWLAAGATFYRNIIGREINVSIFPGASSYSAVGLLIVGKTSELALEDHAMIGLSAQNRAFKHGITFGLTWGEGADHGWPIRSDGTLIGVTRKKYPSVPVGGYDAAYGIDFREATFTSAAFASNGFLVGPTGSVSVGGNQVVTTRRTGWTAPTGTATRTSFNTATVTTAQLAERVKGLIDDLITHGLIGA